MRRALPMVTPRLRRDAQAARLFLDFLLSRPGQAHLVRHAMPSARRDLPAPPALQTPDTTQRAIRVGPALLVLQDKLTRTRFLHEWKRLTTNP